MTLGRVLWVALGSILTLATIEEKDRESFESANTSRAILPRDLSDCYFATRGRPCPGSERIFRAIINDTQHSACSAPLTTCLILEPMQMCLDLSFREGY